GGFVSSNGFRLDAIAAFTTESRSDLSVESLVATAMLSTLSVAAANSPMTARIQCVRRLYHPDTRSMLALNHSSTFSRAFAALSAGAVINFPTAFFPPPGALARGFAAIGAVGAGAGTTVPAAGGAAAVAPASGTCSTSISARAKFRAGMYDGSFRLLNQPA